LLLGVRGLENGLISLAIAFGTSIFIAFLLYLLGRALSVRGTKTEGGLSPYACGEARMPVRPRMDMSRFFTYMILFLIFDIAVPMIALAVLSRFHYVQASIYMALALFAILTPALYLREVRRR